MIHLGLLITIVAICHSQFLTPDQLREQHDLGFGARTHYEMSGSRRTDMFNRINPDYLLRGNYFKNISRKKYTSVLLKFFHLGFFPFWSVALLAFALTFLAIAVIGVIGYLLGCRRPTPEELYEIEFGQTTPDDEFLLGGGGVTTSTDVKIPINRYLDDDQRDFQYDSSPRAERTRIGQSDEDMV